MCFACQLRSEVVELPGTASALISPAIRAASSFAPVRLLMISESPRNSVTATVVTPAMSLHPKLPAFEPLVDGRCLSGVSHGCRVR